ncbi:HsdM family class I SAM-dependent methyltransferase [Paenibacillus polymyxa]|uniref:HsdM family class I SAM-dependent methyltransferase n=1 Tax=Paenibacillus polymyxa TaxID=1406 RepID=UPI0025B6709E|nr:N-6 DNA methylase [Paenibacillus polymyxa]MDN4084337.1 N-6 DNA methylase [Paenibacillus polymyxa]MDN4110155.1 N-6 DNA methylase [Paenibacillus polymyxa]
MHKASIDLDKRYEMILQLLLAKIFDEHKNVTTPTAAVTFQDFEAIGVSGTIAKERLNKVLSAAVKYYEKHLPKPVGKTFDTESNVLVDCSKLLAPIRITTAKRDIIQTFYMKFAKDLYRWDLAQFFTPTTVTDFIIEVLNPQFGEHLKDPACGSSDFLVAAFHRGRKLDSKYADCIWGVDNSKNAVQVSVLNMLLNGDGKTNIKCEDSLEHVNKYSEKYKIMVCNPLFGIKIVEKRPLVLSSFELGHSWTKDENGKFKITEAVLSEQEAGHLFLEVCVKQVEKGGRIGIIVPNGYLGNRSDKYTIFREWLLRNCRLVSICSFPRFTFKTSGADVSASVLFLEKREKPLNDSSEDSDYPFHVGLIENVGWNVGDKKALPVYKRNIKDGSFIVNEDGDYIIDSDFSNILSDLRSSLAVEEFPWLIEGIENISSPSEGWSVNISRVINDDVKTLDPKRLSRKYLELIEEISLDKHVSLTDIVEVIPEATNTKGTRVKANKELAYNYVEIQDIGYGDYRSTQLRGWQLPNRAKHFCEPGDIYVGSIWGSVAKWFLVDNASNNLVVTNGCHRLRIKDGAERMLPDLIAFLCSEAYATQMRALSRGSDGLAEVHQSDLERVLVPLISTKSARDELEPYVSGLIEGRSSIKSLVDQLLSDRMLNFPAPEKRPHHAVLV